MKLRHFLIAALTAALAFTACDGEIEEIGAPELELSVKNLEFPAEGGSQTIEVTSNVDWKLKGYDDNKSWLTITPNKGVASDKSTTVTVTAIANHEMDREQVSITFYGNVLASAKLKISQKGDKGDGLESLTVAEFLEKADDKTAYKLTGRVSGYNSNYVSFDLIDETGSVYVYSVSEASKAKYADVLATGGTVTISGTYYWYEHATDPGKSKVEIMKAEILEYTAPEVVDPSEMEVTTVADFLEAADIFKTCKLEGRVANYSDTYVSFDLKDETGSVYVYSIDAESQELYSSQLKNGDLVTILAVYYWYEHATDPSKSKAEIMSAKIIAYEPLDVDHVEAITIGEFLEKADEITPYQLSGKVTGFYSGTNTSGKYYIGFNLTDSTGSITIYSLDSESMDEYGSAIADGGLMTLIGTYYWFENASDSSKSKPEITGAKIVSYEAPEAIDPDKLEAVSVSEFISRADAITPLKLTGKVSGFYTGTNASGKTYMGFDLVDGSGSITVYSFTAESQDEYIGKLADGGVITLYGYYQYYEKNQKHEVVNATIVSFEAPEVVDPSTIETISVAEFLSRADANTVYRLTGTVSGFNSNYCSFDLVQDGASIYVYAVDAASKAKYQSVIANGGTITLTGKYMWYEHKTDPSKNKAEINPATIESYTAPEGGDNPSGGDPSDKPAAGTLLTVADFLKLADTATSYQLTGTISGLGANYKDFTLTDATGSIYIYSLDSASKSKYGDLLAEGKTVTVSGAYLEYNGKAEIKNAVIVSYEGGSDTPVDPVDPSQFISVTCAEFNALTGSETDIYLLKGTVTQIDNTTYGNLYINDGTASTLIYGVLTTSGDSGKFASLDIKVGDVLTVSGKPVEYNGTIEMKNATFVSREKGPDHDVVAALAHDLTSGISWTKGANSYDNTDTGNNKQTATVNGRSVDNLLKLCTSKAAGSATLTIPSGVTKIGFYAAAWSGGSTLTVNGKTFKIPANGGCTGNAPYTLELSDSANWFEIEVSEGTVAVSADKRVLLIGINAL